MPTPVAASAAWSAGAPATTEPDPRFLLGGVSLPATTPATGADLLTSADPFLAEALPYLQHALNLTLAAPYAAAMAGQAQASNAACVETSPVDPAAYLDTRALRLPLLALYPVSFATSERTMQYERFSVTYRLDYLLPSLTWDQHRRIGALLQAALGVVLLAIRRGGLPSYRSGRRVWDEAGVEAVQMASGEFGGYEALKTAQVFPAASAQILVHLRESDDVDAGLPFWGNSLTTQTVADDGDALTVAQGRTDIP